MPCAAVAKWRIILPRMKAQGKTAKQALVVVTVKLLPTVHAMSRHWPSRLLVTPAPIRI